jgi:ribose transport system substrate-binding protein
MKKSLKIILIVLIAGLCLGFFGYSYNLSKIQIKLADNNSSGGTPLKYHFMLIGQDMGSPFWQSVQAGAESAGEKYGAAVEFNGSMIQDEAAEIEYLNIAIASHVDGIAIYVTDKDKYTPLINKAVSMGIHVVTIESDDKDSNRDSFVGPNSYMVGAYEGELARQSSNGMSQVAIIISGNYAGNADAKESLLNGFADSIRDHSDIKLVTFQDSSPGYFGVESTIRNILSNYPQVNTVVCTDSDGTVEIVQVLLDLALNKKIALIGYDNTPQIRNFIKINDMYGSVYEDPKETGFESIECLVKAINGEETGSFNDTGVYMITRSNLVSYHGS